MINIIIGVLFLIAGIAVLSIGAKHKVPFYKLFGLACFEDGFYAV